MRQILVCVVVVVVGCNAKKNESGPSGPIAQLAVAGAAAEQQLATTPWPSDLFLDDKGHVALAQLPGSPVDLTPVLLADLNGDQDGFGTTTGAYFPVSGTIDPATLDGNLHLYDLADGSEVPLYTHLRAKDLPPAIYARPQFGQVLLEHHRYAYVVTTGVKGPAGALTPSPDLASLLAATSPPTGSLARAYAIYQPLLALLDQSGPSRHEVAAATVFTTHSITKTLVAMRAALESAPAPKATPSLIFAATKQAGDDGTLDDLLGKPAMSLPGLDNAGGVAHDKIGFVVQGSFAAPDYLNNLTAITPGGGTPTAINTMNIVDGIATPKGTATVPFTLVIPNLTTYDKPIPVVLFQHGIGAERSSMMGVANTLAGSGFATLGIDIPFHGGQDPTATDTTHRFGGGSGPDGWSEISDNPSYTFLDATGNSAGGIVTFDPKAIRSAFLQAALDTMQSARLVTVGDVSAIGAKDARLAMLTLRHDAVAYSGESFGSMIGGITCAVEPTVGACVLDVGGGGLVFPLLLNSATFGPIFGILLDGALGTSTVDPSDPADTDFMYNLANELLEGGDTLAYAPYVLRRPLGTNAPKNVLQPSAHYDEVVPNIANEALAEGLGLQPVNLSSGGAVDLGFWPGATAIAAPASANVTVGGKAVTAAFVQLDPATHVMLTWQNGTHQWDVTKPPPYMKVTPTTVMNPIVRLQAIYTRFVSDYFAGKAPSVVDGQ
jgi:hypothetical protein